VRKENKPRWAW